MWSIKCSLMLVVVAGWKVEGRRILFKKPFICRSNHLQWPHFFPKVATWWHHRKLFGPSEQRPTAARIRLQLDVWQTEAPARCIILTRSLTSKCLPLFTERHDDSLKDHMNAADLINNSHGNVAPCFPNKDGPIVLTAKFNTRHMEFNEEMTECSWD